MGIKQAVIYKLMAWLPADEQGRMAVDVVAWMCADLPLAERQKVIANLAPRLMERISKGQFGLRLVICYHLLRLPPLRWLRQRVTLMEAHLSGLAAPPASRWSTTTTIYKE